MCIRSTRILEKEVAKRDIKVYKVLYRYKTDENTLFPPYYSSITYKVGVEAESLLDSCIPTGWWSSTFETGQGLYSYKKKSGAKYLKTIYRQAKIYKCIIPKGSTFITDGEQYVSDKLIVNKKCFFQ